MAKKTTTNKQSKAMEERLTKKYVDVTTDFGFKKIFDVEKHMHITLDFVHAILGRFGEEITELHVAPQELLPKTEASRKSIFDVACTTEDGGTVLIEMQSAWQENFIDRSQFYISGIISNYGEKGDWDYKLKKVYLINILNYKCEENMHNPYKYKSTVVNVDIDAEPWSIWNDRVVSTYIELPKFREQHELWKKDEDKPFDLVAERVKKWLYYISRLPQFEFEPKSVDDPVFQEVLEIAEVSNLTAKERKMYDASLKVQRDNYAIRTSAEKLGWRRGHESGLTAGHAEGMQQGRREERAKAQQEKRATAKKLLDRGVDSAIVSDTTGLSVEELKNL